MTQSQSKDLLISIHRLQRVKAHKKKKLRSLQVDDEYDDYVARLDTMPTAAEELNHARFDDSDDDNPAMVSARGIKEPSSIACE